MRASLITALLSLVFSVNAFALNDAPTVREIARLKQDLAAQSQPAARLERFEVFRDFLFDRLQTMPLPRTAEEQADFNDLNQFEADLFMIEAKNLSPATCTRNWQKIVGANTVADESVPATSMSDITRETLDILKALCTK